MSESEKRPEEEEKRRLEEENEALRKELEILREKTLKERLYDHVHVSVRTMDIFIGVMAALFIPSSFTRATYSLILFEPSSSEYSV